MFRASEEAHSKLERLSSQQEPGKSKKVFGPFALKEKEWEIN